MKKFLFVMTLVSVMVLAGSAFAKKSIEPAVEELPTMISMTVQMPDGSVHVIDFSKVKKLEEAAEAEATTMSIFYLFTLPPLYIWQPGWFMYSGVTFFGWISEGYVYVMGFGGGQWHCFRFENVNHTWLYLGVLQ
jgi:hypothetical protein